MDVGQHKQLIAAALAKASPYLEEAIRLFDEMTAAANDEDGSLAKVAAGQMAEATDRIRWYQPWLSR